METCIPGLLAKLNAEALNAYQVFNHQQFKDEVELLWITLRTRFEAQPLSFLSSHRTVSKDIAKYMQQIGRWLDERREVFDEQCLTYQQLTCNSTYSRRAKNTLR